MSSRKSQTVTANNVSEPNAVTSDLARTPGHKTLNAFLQAHQLPTGKAKANSSTPVHTHTQFGDYCNKYSIPEADENEFERLYYNDVIRTGQIHNMIESQFIRDGTSSGAIVIDLDFRFDIEERDADTSPDGVQTGSSEARTAAVVQPPFERKYTLEDHIMPFVREQMRHIYRLFELDNDSTIPVFVLEKPHPRQKDAATMSDGVHILIGLAAKRTYHTYLRTKAVEWVAENWTSPDASFFLGTSNDAESICDISVATGANGWLKYNSRKKEDTMCYKISAAYEFGIDDAWNGDPSEVYAGNSLTEFGPWIQNCVFTKPATANAEAMFLKKYYHKLSARYRNFSPAILRACCNDELEAYQLSQTRKSTTALISSAGGDGDMGNNNILTVDELRQLVRDEQSLNACLQQFMDNADQIDKLHNVRQMDVREIFEYTMSLPEKYYNKGAYNDRLNVGFALHTYHPKMLIVYLAFCAQRPDFDYANKVPEICDKWVSFVPKSDGVTYLSLRWWSRMDAPERYEEIRCNTLDFFVENVIDTVSLGDVSNPRKKFATGYSDHDVAKILYKMCGPRFRCMSIKQNQWIYFANHRWIADDCGTTLRLMISLELRDLFRVKTQAIMTRIGEITDVESDEFQALTKRAEKIHATWNTLGDARSKDNIMKEARELFFERDLVDKLDSNRFLTCFENGVFDAKTMTFRRGFPEDYITKSTGYNYRPLSDFSAETVDEVKTYLRQLFPIPSMFEYALDHITSTFYGDTVLNQCMHMYEGVGSNGKSMFVKLICLMHGMYAAYLDVGFYTQDRGQLGRANPELYKIIAAHYVYSSEPTEGSKIQEGPMKQMTSGTDDMTAREPFGQLRTFVPQANAAIMTNNQMGMTATDHGSWRRIRRLLFMSLFSYNPCYDNPMQPYQFLIVDNLMDKFDQWRVVLAAIAIDRMTNTRGRVRIELCPEVSDASAAYRKDQDIVAAFIGEKVRRRNGENLKKGELQNEFINWCTQNGDRQLAAKKNKELIVRMEQQFGTLRNGQWVGVGIEYESANYALDDDDSGAGNDSLDTTTRL
jgi:phage/plasmid-associated DNA primase